MIRSAEKLLRGEADIPGFPPVRVAVPFDPHDLDGSDGEWQLQLAGLVVPETLMDAYQATGREEFFSVARDSLLGWAAFERRSWLPRGYLWNDHAVAQRAAVLAQFWSLYRHRPDFNRDVARAILEFSARTAEWLAKPGNFTASTNHGVMENLGLWQLSLAFPYLPDTQRHGALAESRLDDQLSFYVSEEGVVLEHSAGYHEFGLKLMGLAFRFLSWQHSPPPPAWIEKYERARRFYAQVRRPDGSLPVWGDTVSATDQYESVPLSAQAIATSRDAPRGVSEIPRLPFSLFPVSGYAILWDDVDKSLAETNSSQVAITWSNFPGLGHKHADEPSILFWAQGESWWTNVGYWSYGDADARSEAEGWSGSDAPHLVNEPRNSQRETRLLACGRSGSIAAVDLERVGPGNYSARREVVRLSPDIWIVLDSTHGGAEARTTTTWTGSSRLSMKRGSLPGQFEFENQTGAALTAFVLGSPSPLVREYTGSLKPFAGWDVIREPRPAPAVVTEQPANNSWAVLFWTISDRAKASAPFSSPPAMTRWNDAENWSLDVPAPAEPFTMRREGALLRAEPKAQSGKSVQLVLEKAPDVSSQRAEIIQRHAGVLRKYPRFKELLAYRVRASWILLLLWVVQELSFIFLNQIGKFFWRIQILSMLAWLALGVWLYGVYFR